MIWEATIPAAVSYLTVDGDVYNIDGDQVLPQEPATVLVLDNKGRPKWTVSIPSRLPLPLRPNDYATICHQSDQISKHLRESSSIGSRQSGGSLNHYHYDSKFMDVAEAEEHGLLPSAKRINEDLKKRTASHTEDKNHITDEVIIMDEMKGKACERSLTYILESTDAGFGTTLMGLWMSYGLAKKERRAFFIDDTNW